MSVLPRKEIETLLRTSGGPCVSIFQPTVRVGDTQQNSIRFKNLLRTAAERLSDRGLRNPEADQLLDPARRLIDDYSFWEHQSEGLALFLSRDMFKTYQLPLSFDELAVVEDRFHVKPLFPLLNGDGRFYILALSLKNIRLIEATRHGAREIELAGTGVPRSLTEALGDLTRNFSQFQASTSSKTVSRMPIFHGHGTGEDDLKAEIVQFFHRFDNGLSDLPIDRGAPFVLAGVEYLLPRYREASSLPNILEEGLRTGNPEGLRPEELQEAAWEVVEPLFMEDQRREAERYRELAGTGLASSQLDAILPASHDARIEVLFTARGVRVWGRYDSDTRQVHFQEDQEAQSNGSEDLIDRAAIQTWLHGGKVFAVEQKDVPEGMAAVAVFRW
ncbi:MAG TPA: hypothetical protein VMW27_21470 [Thermoanaerobaculia bacterium]|nr:hypothetical protein [Thermoanaerobaculia bacterium]